MKCVSITVFVEPLQSFVNQFHGLMVNPHWVMGCHGYLYSFFTLWSYSVSTPVFQHFLCDLTFYFVLCLIFLRPFPALYLIFSIFSSILCDVSIDFSRRGALISLEIQVFALAEKTLAALRARQGRAASHRGCWNGRFCWDKVGISGAKCWGGQAISVFCLALFSKLKWVPLNSNLQQIDDMFATNWLLILLLGTPLHTCDLLG